MPTLIFRTSGKKIKKAIPSIDEKIFRLLIATGSTPKEAKNRLKLINLTNSKEIV